MAATDADELLATAASAAAANDDELRQALRQPLVVAPQLPLILEGLLARLALHSAALAGLGTKVAALERRGVAAAELPERLRLLEERCVLSPGAPAEQLFAQAQLAQRLAALEQQAAALEASAEQLRLAQTQAEPRLALCEARLAGCSGYDLADGLMTLRAAAAELGLPPQPRHPSMLTHHELTRLGGVAAGGARDAGPGGGAAFSSLAPAASSPPPAAAAGVLTVSRQQALQAQIDGGRRQLDAAQEQLRSLQQTVDRLAADAAAASDHQLGLLAGLRDDTTALSQQLMQQAATLRREMRPALQAAEVQTLSLAEFSALAAKAEAAAARTAAVEEQLAALKAKDLAVVSASVAQLSRSVARVVGAPGAVSNTERALAAAQAELRAQLQGCAGRLAAVEAAQTAACEVAHEQPAAGAQDSSSLRSAVSRAVAVALQQLAAGADAAPDDAAASRTRCLVCERALRSPSPSPPPSGDFSGGSPAAAPGGVSAPASAANAAGRASGSTRLGPMGPGVCAAQHRQRSGRPTMGAPPASAGPSARGVLGGADDDLMVSGSLHVRSAAATPHTHAVPSSSGGEAPAGSAGSPVPGAAPRPGTAATRAGGPCSASRPGAPRRPTTAASGGGCSGGARESKVSGG